MRKTKERVVTYILLPRTQDVTPSLICLTETDINHIEQTLN